MQNRKYSCMHGNQYLHASQSMITDSLGCSHCIGPDPQLDIPGCFSLRDFYIQQILFYKKMNYYSRGTYCISENIGVCRLVSHCLPGMEHGWKPRRSLVCPTRLASGHWPARQETWLSRHGLPKSLAYSRETALTEP